MTDKFKDVFLGKVCFVTYETDNSKMFYNGKIKQPIKLHGEDGELLDYIVAYAARFGNEERLFDFTPVTGWNIMKKHLNANPHWLRHSRLTYLATTKQFSNLYLQEVAGWSDSRMADVYCKITWEDIVKKM